MSAAGRKRRKTGGGTAVPPPTGSVWRSAPEGLHQLRVGIVTDVDAPGDILQTDIPHIVAAEGHVRLRLHGVVIGIDDELHEAEPGVLLIDGSQHGGQLALRKFHQIEHPDGHRLAVLIEEEAQRQGRDVHIHIGLDTGMSRIGFADRQESVEEIKKISQLPNLKIEGMFTHFARADETDRSPAIDQLNRYLNFAKLLEDAGIQIPMKHCSNSAGIIRVPEANLNAVRAGITIYGIYPSNEVERDIVKLIPAMELKSHISYIKTVEPGAAFSYGGTFTAKKEMKVATIPVGYADGYPRSLSNKGWVLIHGKKAPILGRVCMDQFMVDITKIPDAKAGDEVTLIGKDGKEFISIEKFGDLSGRFSYEFACDISKRVPRVYIKDGKEWGELTFFN